MFQECLHLHLFDEVAIDLIDEEHDRSSHVHQRLERKWLGSLDVPFSSLYHNTRIEGTFRLHSPPVLLGYERSGNALVAAASATAAGAPGSGRSGGGSGEPTETAGGTGSGTSSSKKMAATFLNIYLTIQPALMVPQPIKEKLDCEETAPLVQHCETWAAEFGLAFPNRAVSAILCALFHQVSVEAAMAEWLRRWT